jgi:nitroreductase
MTFPDAETLDHLLKERHSCRAFLPQAVPLSVQQDIFRTAQRTGSWCNSQAWQVTVASGAAVEKFREAMVQAAQSGQELGKGGGSDFPFPAEYKGVYLERRRDCGFGLYNAVGVPRGDKAGYAKQTLENFRLFGAPHVAILTSEPGLGVYGAVDVGGYVQVLMLAMQAHGVGSIAQAALASHSALAKSLLGIPADRLMVCAISFGFEDKNHIANSYRLGRADIADVVTWVDEVGD